MQKQPKHQACTWCSERDVYRVEQGLSKASSNVAGIVRGLKLERNNLNIKYVELFGEKNSNQKQNWCGEGGVEKLKGHAMVLMTEAVIL